MEHMDFINQYMNDTIDIVKNIDRKEIDKAVNILFEAWKGGNQVFFVGNGGSAGTASHFAADLSKTTITNFDSPKRFKSISLVENISLLSAWINDRGWENVFVGQLENQFKPGDVVVGLSVHGGHGEGDAGAWSQNLPKAMQYAKDNGGKTIGLTGFDGGWMGKNCDANINVPMESTPHAEGFHGVLQHMIIFRLKELIAEETKHHKK